MPALPKRGKRPADDPKTTVQIFADRDRLETLKQALLAVQPVAGRSWAAAVQALVDAACELPNTAAKLVSEALGQEYTPTGRTSTRRLTSFTDEDIDRIVAQRIDDVPRHLIARETGRTERQIRTLTNRPDIARRIQKGKEARRRKENAEGAYAQ